MPGTFYPDLNKLKKRKKDKEGLKEQADKNADEAWDKFKTAAPGTCVFTTRWRLTAECGAVTCQLSINN